ncbi:Signal peptidase I OS=Streptomyces tendae OX=1932 GN=lepB PE=3 SV=1 [Streptomyces tendae]
MGSRGKPRGAPSSPAENLLPTGSRRTAAPSGGRSRAERRKLQRKVKRRRRRGAVKEIPLLVGVAVLIALVLKTFLVQAFVIPSGSMEQTIRIGDRVLVDKLTPWFGSEPQRGDVVVFRDPAAGSRGEQTTKKDDPVVVKQVKEGLAFIGLLPSDDEKDLIKRVVAVGGDHAPAAQQGKLNVNGKVINEAYLPDDTPAEISDFQTVTVPDGRLFLLGDERDNSADSTAHLTDAAGGTVSRGAVDARVDAVAWPMNGMLERPTGFETLGDLSSPGPLRTVVVLVIAGAVLILGGAAYGPLAKRAASSRAREEAEPTGGR